jgi:hypothetical protein
MVWLPDITVAYSRSGDNVKVLNDLGRIGRINLLVGERRVWCVAEPSY